MHKKKDDIRDIYQTGEQDTERDFSPQVAQERVEDRQRDLRRNQVSSVFFGSVLVILSIVLTVFVVRDFLGENKPSRNRLPQLPAYLPRSSLPPDALWVMNCPEEQITDKEASGPRPLSAHWVKTAANYTIMGQQSLAQNHSEEALNYFQKVVELYPDIRGLHRAMGTLYLKNGVSASAAEHLEKALKEEESFDVVNNLGAAYVDLEKYDQAEPLFLRALDMQPDNPACQKNLAELYRKTGRDEKAVYHFEKYLDLRPNDLETLQTYTFYLAKLGRWAATSDFLTKLTQEITDVAPLYFLLAQAQIQTGQPDKAVESLKRGAQLLDPELALIWVKRDDFKSVQGSSDFKALVLQLEKAR